MKRFLALLLVVLIIAGLAGCGKDYSKHQFDYLGDDFSWDMTVEDAVQYIDVRQTSVKTEIEVNDYDTFTTVVDRFYVFHFDEEGKLELVKHNLYGNDKMLVQLQERYGEYDEYEDSYNAYIWYGTMAGRNTVMSFVRAVDYSIWLEFKPA